MRGRMAWVWTAEKCAEVQALIKPKRTAREIAELAGLTQKAVEKAFAKGKIRRRASHREVSRRCLCCGHSFRADTPFIRRCVKCRDRGSSLGDMFVGAS
jgi:hypothetical protein